MRALPVFDCDALIDALDAQRADRDLGWTALADELWQQSAELNAALSDNALCPGALVRTTKRGAMSCQYALIILRWIRRAAVNANSPGQNWQRSSTARRTG
jgi:hypothetical protein